MHSLSMAFSPGVIAPRRVYGASKTLVSSLPLAFVLKMIQKLSGGQSDLEDIAGNGLGGGLLGELRRVPWGTQHLDPL